MKPARRIFSTKAFQYKVVRDLAHKGFSVRQLLQFYDDYHAEGTISKSTTHKRVRVAVNLYDWAHAFDRLINDRHRDGDCAQARSGCAAGHRLHAIDI